MLKIKLNLINPYCNVAKKAIDIEAEKHYAQIGTYSKSAKIWWKLTFPFHSSLMSNLSKQLIEWLEGK